MQFTTKVKVLFTCFLGSLADIAFVQMKPKEMSSVNSTFVYPSSTCSKTSGSNLYRYCPQNQCYGDSQCCLSTGACTTFESSVCANANQCASGSCASSGASSFPVVRSSKKPSSYHLKTIRDGCTCVKAKDTCTSGYCWGTMQCTKAGSCQTTQQCTDGVDVADVGDFCMMLAADPSCFKFCGVAPTPDPTPDPTSSPTLAPTHNNDDNDNDNDNYPNRSPTRRPTLAPTPAPTLRTPAPTTKPAPVPTPLPTLAPTLAPTPAPTPLPTPQPTLEPTPAPTPLPTPAPTPEPTPAPTPLPTPAPTLAPTPAPTPHPTPQPTPEPTPAPTPLPTLAPTPEPTLQPTPEPTPAPTPRPTGAPTPSTTTTTTCSTYAGTTSCTLYNDPHLHSFDDSEEDPASLRGARFLEVSGVSLTGNVAFSGHPIYLDVGDYWLIKSDLLSIQGRYVSSASFKQGGAVVGAIALGGLALDGKRLLVEPRNGSVTWDGHALSFGAFRAHVSDGNLTVLNSEAEVHSVLPFSQVVIHLPVSVDLLINRYDTFLNIKITMPTGGLLSMSNIEGQCGNSNGVEEDDTLSEIERRMHGSVVLPQQSLFD